MNVNKTGIAQFKFALLLLIFCSASACNPSPDPDVKSDGFETVPQKFNITPGIIDEASGLTESANLNGYLWTNQDSGAPNSLYLISKDGKSIKEYKVPGSENHDWEDITSGPGPNSGVNYLYIGDTGNNNLPMTETNIIYRIPEISDLNGSFQSSQLEKIRFRYPDGPRDAETLLLDPKTKDIFIISKESAQTGIYRLPYPQSTSETITAERTGAIPSVAMATSGDISVGGNEIIIRTYFSVLYWTRKEGETVSQTLSQSATKILPVALEPQGEGICFDRQSSGFYTLSEKGSASSVTLNYYKRK